MANNISPSRQAALCVFLLGVYYQIVEWVDLFPWNNVKNGNGQEGLDLIVGAATLLLIGLLWFAGRLAAIAVTLILGLWVYLQIDSWWLPYFTGASQSWKRVYEHWFSQTVSILPKDADHLPPDANHFVLHILILLALGFAVKAAFAGRSNPR